MDRISHFANALFIECRGEDARYFEDLPGWVVDARPSTPREARERSPSPSRPRRFKREVTPFDDWADDGQNAYFVVPKDGIRTYFGFQSPLNQGLGLVSIQLPRKLKTSKISQLHFTIVQLENRVWMLEDFSLTGTIINGVQLSASKERRNSAYDDGFIDSSEPTWGGPPAPGENPLSQALDPSVPNKVCIGDLHLLIHVLDGPRDLGSSEQHPFGLRPPPSQQSSYCVQPPRDNLPQLAIEKHTGYVFAVKLYPTAEEKEKARKQDAIASSLQNHSNILASLELLETTVPMMLSLYYRYAQYLDERCFAPHEIVPAFSQLLNALDFLKDKEILHQDIRPRTILVIEDRFWEPFCLKVTGFSESERATQGFHRDASDLCSTMRACMEEPLDRHVIRQLYGPELEDKSIRRPHDPALKELFSRGGENLCSSALRKHAQEILPGGSLQPFGFVSVVRTVDFPTRIYGKHEWFQFLYMIRDALACYPSHHDAIRQIVKETLFHDESNGKRPGECTRREAQIFRHRLKSLWRNGPSMRTANWDLGDMRTPGVGEISNSTTAAYDVSYHKPSRMYNVTQLLNVCDGDDTATCLSWFKSREASAEIRELRGTPEWEGFYIDEQHFLQLAAKLGLKILHDEDEPKTQATPFGLPDLGPSITLATREVFATPVYLKGTGKVCWGLKSHSIQEAAAVCKEHHLRTMHDTIQDLETRPSPHWATFWPNTKIVDLVPPAGTDRPTTPEDFHDPDAAEKSELRWVRKSLRAKRAWLESKATEAGVEVDQLQLSEPWSPPRQPHKPKRKRIATSSQQVNGPEIGLFASMYAHAQSSGINSQQAPQNDPNSLEAKTSTSRTSYQQAPQNEPGSREVPTSFSATNALIQVTESEVESQATAPNSQQLTASKASQEQSLEALDLVNYESDLETGPDRQPEQRDVQPDPSDTQLSFEASYLEGDDLEPSPPQGRADTERRNATATQANSSQTQAMWERYLEEN